MSENPNPQTQPQAVTEGPYAGWNTWGLGSDPFETLTGPYHMKPDGAGGQLCAFTPGPQNANGMGAVHGGALMTFADFALFAHAHAHMDGTPCVTVQFESQFIGAGRVGTMIVSKGEVVRATRSCFSCGV
jgi:acyl-coenzyme A thioesterase PaaI-like protein